MERNLSIGTLAALPGEKVQGMLPIPHTEIEVPVTLITAANTSASRPPSSWPASWTPRA